MEMKLAILERLVDAGIELFDAAFPESSPDEAAFLAEAVKRFPAARLGASCRLIRGALMAAVATGANELFAVVPVSDVHLEKRLGIDRPRMLERLVAELDGIRRHASLNVVLEDAFRADPVFVAQCAALSAGLGARRVFLSDTVGVVLPWKVKSLVRSVRDAIPREVDLGSHFHDDFGLGLANSLAAVEAGATHPTAAVNGLGERAGNTDLAQLAAAISLLMGRECGVRLDRLRPLSDFVMRISGILVSQRSPITGYNAFRHTSGVHVHGMLADRHTYEGFDPEVLGAKRELVLGKHSGRRHIRHLLGGSDDLSPELVERVLKAVKQASRATSGNWAEALYEVFRRFNEECLGFSEDEFQALVERIEKDLGE